MGFTSSVSSPTTGLAGNYTLIVTGSNGCTTTAMAFVGTDTISPVLSVLGGEITCLESEATLTAIFSPAGSTITWTGPGNFSANIASPSTTVGGTYEATVVGTNGCTASSSASVVANNQPTWSLELGPDLFVEEKKPVYLSVMTDLPASQTSEVSWDFPPQVISANCSNCSNPAITLSESAAVHVTLTDIYGCSQTALVYIEVQQTSAIYVPNVFAPTGSFENQIFQIQVGADAHVLNFPSFRIFDRWGSLVHEYLNFMPNDAGHGWDGVVRGDQAQPGVYVWYLEAVFENGAKRFMKGDVTLVR